jgi:hypothetical protein
MRVGRYTFDEVVYDAPSDVLYASIGKLESSRRQATPEEHLWHFDEKERFRGLTLIGPREQMERQGAVYVSLPTGELERVQGIDAMLHASAR